MQHAAKKKFGWALKRVLDNRVSSCNSISATCPICFCLFCTAASKCTEKQLLEVIFHSCRKRQYWSPGFIAQLPCDVNASPDGLMSVAVVQARVSLQTTVAAAWLSPGISRVTHIGHCSAGSAHLHHCLTHHDEWLMKGLFEPLHVWSTFYLQSHHRHGKVERDQFLPLWSSNSHRYATGWATGQANAGSRFRVCGVYKAINIFPLKECCWCCGSC